MSKKKLGRGLDALLGAQFSEDELKNAPLEGASQSPDGATPTSPVVNAEKAGLSAGGLNAEASSASDSSASSKAVALSATVLTDSDLGDGTRLIRLDPRKLEPNPDQPRTFFSEEALKDLATSLKEHGLLQPVLATHTDDGRYVIIAGERRTKASILAGLSEIPVLLTKLDATQNLELALIENIQRENLNPIEEAQAYKKLLAMYDLSQEELAKKLGKSRPAIANTLRLLQLPDYAIQALEQNQLTSGHARTILSALTPTDQRKIFDAIINEGLSVRSAETFAANLNKTADPKPIASSKKPQKDTLPSELAEMQQLLIEKLGTKVAIRGSDQRGVIEISYFSKDDINALYEKLLGQT